MQYLGGKSRIAKKLSPIILDLTKGRTLIEPFCGGLSMTEKLHPVYASDASIPLIALIQAVRSGWDPPVDVSEAEYAIARTLPETYPAHGFCGFGCSFGGKLWGGYARQPSTGLNFAATARRSLLRKIAATTDTDFGCRSYSEYYGNRALAFYCDPPYAGTTGYKGGFDSRLFWQWCTQQVSRGAIVLVSEFSAPLGVADCVCVVDDSSTMHTKTRSKATVELLYKVR